MTSRANRELRALVLGALLLSASGVAAQTAPATSTADTPSASAATPAEAAPESAPEVAEPPSETVPEASEQADEPRAESTEQALVESETPPATDPQPASIRLVTTSGDARVDSDEEPEQPKTCGSGSIALSSGGCTKPWRLIGYAEYRQLAVTDDDPAAGRSMRMFLQGSYRVAKKHNVQLWGRVRYLQNFVAEEGESAARFQDPILGVDYMQQLSYADRGQKWANLFLQHRLTGTIPAQRESRANDLYTRISGLERVRLIPIPSVYVGPDLTAGYNVYEYAEQPGPQGTVNEQADFSGMLVAEWYPWQHDRYGAILLGADAGLSYALNYKGRGGELVQQENRWSQNYNWDVYAYYMPVPQLWLGGGVSHGMGLLRDGVAVVDFVNRDATLLSVNCVALY